MVRAKCVGVGRMEVAESDQALGQLYCYHDW